ncbi:2-phosphosulfolactate phosphatase [Fictibacillus barbaricus]|uniref:Probable 2-phosphosulfolactate phosphatase n=1 Tax=Fictibacillus barbaricus TaxID=182136 RepID=A0ABU1U0P5_9BACL|nr:2-phosphosulfolactate phosphatase [Fictibacillus barbaricus]MDR7072996.1 2-phosphosulfolactate phosphatase [Fictibacillus barbaricus]
MFDQSPYEIKFDWGIRGAREAAKREDIIIIVDVLSFSSTVTAAIRLGAVIYPFPPPINTEARKYALSMGAELVVGRAEAIKTGQHSLSPVSFSSADAGKSFVLCSLNGAACVEAAKKVPALLIGSLINADAAAQAALSVKMKTKRNITVIACGERWENHNQDENELRPGIEDYLGAGAILSALTGTFSPEALVCQKAFQAVKNDLAALIKDCGSGRELEERGFSEDVSFCSQYNTSSIVPILSNNQFIPFELLVKN